MEEAMGMCWGCRTSSMCHHHIELAGPGSTQQECGSAERVNRHIRRLMWEVLCAWYDAGVATAACRVWKDWQ